MAERERKKLFEALKTCQPTEEEGFGDFGPFVDFVRRHGRRLDDFDLSEFLQSLPRKDHERMWALVLSFTEPLVDSGVCIAVDEEEEEGEKSDQQERERSSKEGGGETEGEKGEESTLSLRLAAEGGTDGTNTSPTSACSRGAAPERGESLPAEDQGKEAGNQEALTEEACMVLNCVVTLASVEIANPKTVAASSLLQTMVKLHDILLLISGGREGVVLQSNLARVCEAWWVGERPGAEHLMPSLIPLMMVRTLEESAKEADVKRMYGLRAGLLLLDFEDQSSEGLRELLLRAYLHPLYLRSVEGRRFLTYCLGLSPNFVRDVYTTVKAQLPGARKAVLKVYGEVLFKAWRGAEGAYSATMESNLQDLMRACVLAATPVLFGNLLLLLGAFHEQKRQKGVDTMLLKLYGPILWRSLKVANPVVRRQSCTVLADAFPLHDPDMGPQASDEILQRQFDAFRQLLQDSDPRVRSAAAKGVCRVLVVYWEAIPLATIKALLSRIAGQLAFDAASPAVRLASIQGIQSLLECPLSHPVLKNVLPSMKNALHDSNPRVRLAFVRLLTAVKHIRSIRFYHVCPVDHLLARLAEDGGGRRKAPAVASAMTGLLLNSYFPQGNGVTGAQQVSRCLAFQEQNLAAASVFYSFFHEHTSVGSVAKMVAMLAKCVLVAVDNEKTAATEVTAAAAVESDRNGNMPAAAKKRPEKKENKKRSKPSADHDESGDENEDKENGSVRGGGGGGGGGGAALTASDEAQMSALLGFMATMWESVARKLAEPAYESAAELLHTTFSGTVVRLLYDTFKYEPTCRSHMLRIAGLVGVRVVPGLLEDLVGELVALPDKASAADFGALVTLLCAWNQQEHLFAALLNSLEYVFLDGEQEQEQESGSSTRGPAGRRAKRRRGRDEGGVGENASVGKGGGGGGGGGGGTKGGSRLPPSLALSLLSFLLRGGVQERGDCRVLEARDALLADTPLMKRLKRALSAARDKADERLWHSAAAGTTCVDLLLARAVEMHGRLSLHEYTAAAVAANRDGVGGLGTQMGRAAAGAVHAEDAQTQGEGLSDSMRGLMDWISGSILPILGGEERKAGCRSKPQCSPTKKKSTTMASYRLAQALFGVAVALSSDWLDVGCAVGELAEYAERWGGALLAALQQQQQQQQEEDEEEEKAREAVPIEAWDPVGPVLPQLCRLVHVFATMTPSEGGGGGGAGAGAGGAPASLWEVLLRSAQAKHAGGGAGGARLSVVGVEDAVMHVHGSACVDKLLRTCVLGAERRGTLEGHVERLLAFVYSQSRLKIGEKADGDDEEDVMNTIALGKDGRQSTLLFTSAADAVSDSLFRSASSTKAALAVTLRYFRVMRKRRHAHEEQDFADQEGERMKQEGGGERERWDMFVMHLLRLLLDNAHPATASLVAVGVYSELAKTPACVYAHGQTSASEHGWARGKREEGGLDEPEGGDDEGSSNRVERGGDGGAEVVQAILSLYNELELLRQAALAKMSTASNGKEDGEEEHHEAPAAGAVSPPPAAADGEGTGERRQTREIPR